MAELATKPTAEDVVGAITKTKEDVAGVTAQVTSLLKEFGEVKEALKEAAAGKPIGAPGIRTGEDPLTSRPYSFARHFDAIIKQKAGITNWGDNAKVELQVAQKLQKAFNQGPNGGASLSQFCAPLATALMPQDWSEIDKENGGDLGGVPADVVKEIQDHFRTRPGVDKDEMAYLRRHGIIKDSVRNDATLGGSLVPMAAQGELIELLRNTMVFTRAPGTRMVPLPPQGSIRYPSQTSHSTISAYSEGATVSESDIGTGFTTMSAKAYRGLIDVTEELMKFAGVPSVEALIREDLAAETQRQLDRDMIYGPGGTKILGVINMGSIKTRAATTVATNGNTLGTDDIQLLIADMAGANAPVDRGVAVAIRPELWAGLTTRKDTYGRYMFSWATDNQSGMQSMFGHPIIQSTNVPNTRLKGSGTTLTLVLVFVPSEILIGQAGVIDFAMTDSDASKFTQGVSTIKVTTYADMVVRHVVSIGLTDSLLNS